MRVLVGTVTAPQIVGEESQVLEIFGDAGDRVFDVAEGAVYLQIMPSLVLYIVKLLLIFAFLSDIIQTNDLLHQHLKVATIRLQLRLPNQFLYHLAIL